MNIKHILNKHRLEAFVVLFLIVVATLYFSGLARAVNGPSGGYIAPAILDPTCTPGATDCFVNPFVVGEDGVDEGSEVARAAKGSIPFFWRDTDADGVYELTEDNTNLYWDDLNDRLGIGTAIPEEKLHIETGEEYGLLHVGSSPSVKVGTWIGPQGSATAWFGTKSNHSLYLFTNGGDMSSPPDPTMVIDRNGNVSIGLGAIVPSARLTIGPDGAITTTEKSLTDAATINVDWGEGNQQEVTLGGNRTINFSNYVASQTLRLIICQTTGSETVTWGDPNLLWSGDSAPTLTPTAGRCDVLTFLATEASGSLKVFGSSVLDFAP